MNDAAADPFARLNGAISDRLDLKRTLGKMKTRRAFKIGSHAEAAEVAAAYGLRLEKIPPAGKAIGWAILAGEWRRAVYWVESRQLVLCDGQTETSDRISVPTIIDAVASVAELIGAA